MDSGSYVNLGTFFIFPFLIKTYFFFQNLIYFVQANSSYIYFSWPLAEAQLPFFILIMFILSSSNLKI